MSLLEEGQIIRGTYEVERFLGQGAFAEVFRVKHRFLGRQAMKVFKTVGLTIEETEEMLVEAILLSRLGHPHIVRVFDANVTDTSKGARGFFTMEYVAGGSLEQYWKSHGIRLVPVAEAVEILRQVCRGLAVAHSENPPIVHRDIKPQNILVGYDAAGLRARVSDFGLAKRVNPLTLLASSKGTPCFKSPEAFSDPQGDSCAGDVWALGTTLYLLLTDNLPFPDLIHGPIFDPRQFEKPITPPSRVNVDADVTLDQIVSRCLALRPSDRYKNALEVLADLERWSPQRPDKPISAKRTTSSQTLKITLGGAAASPHDEQKARKMAGEAVELAKHRRLTDAADLMEEAFNRWPDLRDEHEHQLRLWRKGIMY